MKSFSSNEKEPVSAQGFVLLKKGVIRKILLVKDETVPGFSRTIFSYVQLSSGIVLSFNRNEYTSFLYLFIVEFTSTSKRVLLYIGTNSLFFIFYPVVCFNKFYKAKKIIISKLIFIFLSAL